MVNIFGLLKKSTSQSILSLRSANVSTLIQHQSLPAVLASTTLWMGYFLALLIFKERLFPYLFDLSAIAIFTVFLILAYLKNPLPVPTLKPKAIFILRITFIFFLCLEIYFFGIPLLGQIPYNEFGFPIIHHLVVMYWVLVLFGSKWKELDLLISLFISALIFNRQVILYALIAYLMTRRVSFYKILLYLLIILISGSILGIIRNSVLGVSVAGTEVLYSQPLFFIYLYLLGPLHAAFNWSSDIWLDFLVLYWNTRPEWVVFASDKISYSMSFIIFYGSLSLIVIFLRRVSNQYCRVMGSLVHVYSFLSFFSSTLISTSIIASFLTVSAAGFWLGWRNNYERSNITS